MWITLHTSKLCGCYSLTFFDRIVPMFDCASVGEDRKEKKEKRKTP